MESAVTAAVLVVHAIAILGVLLIERRQPTATLAWMLTLIFLPIAGVLIYLAIGTTRFRRISKASQSSVSRISEITQQNPVLAAVPDPLGSGTDRDPRTESMLRLGRGLSKLRASRGNAVDILVDGKATYAAMTEAIDAARDHVHIEFYIIQPDATGRRLRDQLVRRARDGITVRVLYDAVGSRSLPGDFWDPLRAAGGRAEEFLPAHNVLTRLRNRDRIDFRNHRKIIVVDGRIGFTGGINIGGEYLGLDPDIGEWRDTHLSLRGPAALNLQQVFLIDWLIATGEAVDEPSAFPDLSGSAPEGCPECIVQIVDSGPDRSWSAIEHIVDQALALAEERAWIANPYFIPSQTIQDALISAALRGVDVRLMLPARSDSLLVSLASASYFPELLEAGVRIFHYEQGFLHAKTLVIDSWVGSVGSANMDLRSFNLNFELNAFVYGATFVDELADVFLDDLARTTEYGLEQHSGVGVPLRLARAGARLLSPLL